MRLGHRRPDKRPGLQADWLAVAAERHGFVAGVPALGPRATLPLVVAPGRSLAGRNGRERDVAAALAPYMWLVPEDDPLPDVEPDPFPFVPPEFMPPEPMLP